ALLGVTEEMEERMEAQASKVLLSGLLRWTKVFAEADGELRTTAYRQLPLEMALVESILPPAEAAGPVRDRSADIASSAEQVGVASQERIRSAEPTVRGQGYER